MKQFYSFGVCCALLFIGMNASALVDQGSVSVEENVVTDIEKGDPRDGYQQSMPADHEKVNKQACVEEKSEETVSSSCSGLSDSPEVFSACVSHAKAQARKACSQQTRVESSSAISPQADGMNQDSNQDLR